MSQQSCKNCKFYKRLEVEAGPNPYQIDGAQLDYGYCRRFPPTPLEIKATSTPPVVATQPIVRPTEWCGEWVETLDLNAEV